jgi:hypothetical protein
LIGVIGGLSGGSERLILTSDVLFVMDFRSTSHTQACGGHHKKTHGLLEACGTCHSWKSTSTPLIRVFVCTVGACTVQSEFALNLQREKSRENELTSGCMYMHFSPFVQWGKYLQFSLGWK